MTVMATIMVMIAALVTAILVAIICYLDGNRERDQPFLTTDVEISGVQDRPERAEPGDGRGGDERGKA